MLVDVGAVLVPFGIIWCDFEDMLVHYGVIWDAKLEATSVLRHLVGPMAAPNGSPEGPRVPCWLIGVSFWEHLGG